MWPASWSTNIFKFYYSDINLFLIDDAWRKLRNIWLFLCDNNSRSITVPELNTGEKSYCSYKVKFFSILAIGQMYFIFYPPFAQ